LQTDTFYSSDIAPRGYDTVLMQLFSVFSGLLKIYLAFNLLADVFEDFNKKYRWNFGNLQNYDHF
jgi:hypothetical protein